MKSPRLLPLSGLGLIAGSLTFVAHIVLRSMITAGGDPSTFPKQALWVPVNALGAIGAAMVVLGLPGMYAWIARAAGLLGLIGVVLVAAAWMFVGVFLSLYALIVFPWLADHAPSLVAASAPLPVAFLVAFIVSMVAWLVGTALLAIPFIRGRLQPRWVGYLLPASALWVVVGNVLIAPTGPAANVAINLLSNFGPVLLLIAVGYLGSRMWLEQDPASLATPTGRGGSGRAWSW